MYEEYENLSDLQLIRKTWDTAVTNPGAVSVDRLLRLRASEREAEAGAKLIESTDRLVAATHRLGEVTWWLVVATIILGFAAVIQLVVMVYLGTK
jgi:hypothetical protein